MPPAQIRSTEDRPLALLRSLWVSWRLVASAALFVIIPAIFLIATSQLKRANGPQWLPASFENPYAYLFNSLLILKGEAPAWIDHPGTTTQVFGALILRASSRKSTEQLIASVIQNPEKFITRLHWALEIFTALSLWICPWIVALSLRRYIAGLLIQAPSLFYKILVYYGILFGSDLMLVSFSVAAISLCALLLVQRPLAERIQIVARTRLQGLLRRPKTIFYLRFPLIPALAGLVCALGIVTKLTFFPLILIALFCCRTLRNVATFLAALFVGAAVALIPIYSQLPRVAGWIVSLATHKGDYGTGEVGFPNVGDYLEAMGELLEGEPLLGVIPILATIVLLVSVAAIKGSGSPRTGSNTGTALVLFGVQLISFLAVAKHPGGHYLIPLYLSTGLNLVLLYSGLCQGGVSAIKRSIGFVVLLVLLLLGFVSFVESTRETYASLRDDRIAQLRLYARVKRETKNDVRVDYFRSVSPEYALEYGDGLSRNVFGPLLAKKYPHALFFCVFNGAFQTFDGFIDPAEELQRHDHLYFFGDDMPDSARTAAFDPKTLTDVDQEDGYYLRKWTRK